MHRTIDANICELERFIDAFESALTDSPDARVEDFAPPCIHAQYGEIVTELLRIDLERGWRCGQPSSLESYRERFREVLADPIWLAGLAFEDYRLRREAGQPATAIEYSRRYGIDVSNWPPLDCSERSLSRSTGGAVASESRSAFNFPQVSQTFLNFELVEEIGRGAFGRVYLARQAGLANRPVALKLTPGTSVEPDRLAQLQHTNIVPIYSVHQANGFQAVCMPYLGRQTLVDVLRETRRNGRLPRSGQELLTTVVAQHSETLAIDRPPNETAAKSAAVSIRPCDLAPSIRSRFECSSYVDAVAWIVSQVAAGVAHAHERGILHRDLKPANILLADDGRPMVLDFNLSDQLRPSTGRAAVVGGTVPYMSPEQLESLETGIGVDPRSDVYSIGVMLFELLTGRLPFEASTISGTASIASQASARRSALRQFVDSMRRRLLPSSRSSASAWSQSPPTDTSPSNSCASTLSGISKISRCSMRPIGRSASAHREVDASSSAASIGHHHWRLVACVAGDHRRRLDCSRTTIRPRRSASGVSRLYGEVSGSQASAEHPWRRCRDA